MHIEVEAHNELCILRLKGRFVTGSDSDYSRTRDELGSGGFRKVLADFSEVPYIDSTGINFVVGLYKALKNSGGRLVLANVSHRVREILELTRLHRIIPVFENQQAALSALDEPESTLASAKSSSAV